MFEISQIAKGLLTNISKTQSLFAKANLPIFTRKETVVKPNAIKRFNRPFRVSDLEIIIERDWIHLRYFNYRAFQRAIKKTFENPSILKIFDVVYNPIQLSRYERGKIATKKQVAIDEMRFKPFFSMEVINILNIMALKYNKVLYRKMARILIDNTHIRNIGLAPYKTEIDQRVMSCFDVKMLHYQKEFIESYDYLKKVLLLRGMILSFDQGLGKTLTALFLSEHLKKEQIIIICPNTLKNTWANEIINHMPIYQKDPSFIYIEGDVTKKFKSFDAIKTKYLIVNNESIYKILPKVNMDKKTMIIIDECHNFRYLGGVRINMLLNLISVFEENNVEIDVLPMSGTPIKAKPSEIVPAMMLIDPLFDTECAEIYSKCFDTDNTLAYNVINQRFSMIIYRKLKQDVLSLPEKKEEIISFEIPKPEPYFLDIVERDVWVAFKRHYDELYSQVKPYAKRYNDYVLQYSHASQDMTKSYLNYIHNTIIKNESVHVHEFTLSQFKNFSTQYIKPYIFDQEVLKDFENCELRYIKVYGSALGRAFGEILPKRRAQMFIDIIDTHRSYFIGKIKESINKVCLFSSSKKVIAHLTKIMEEEKIGSVTITGDNANERPQLIQKWKESEKIKVMIASNTVIGVGVTLVESNIIYVFGTPWRKADLNQLSDRIHRIGQTETCYINIVGLKSEKPNLFDRMLYILSWSGKMTDSYIEGWTAEEE